MPNRARPLQTRIPGFPAANQLPDAELRVKPCPSVALPCMHSTEGRTQWSRGALRRPLLPGAVFGGWQRLLSVLRDWARFKAFLLAGPDYSLA